MVFFLQIGVKNVEKMVRNWGGYTQPGFFGRTPVFMAAITGYHGLESSSDFVEIVLRLSVTQ